MAYDNTDSGALFKNEDKQTDKHPDYKGSLNVGGVNFWISAWLKTSEKGRKYMSLAVTAKQEKPAEAPKSKAERAKAFQAGGDDMDVDSIPF